MKFISSKIYLLRWKLLGRHSLTDTVIKIVGDVRGIFEPKTDTPRILNT